jgi:predicted metal-dependent enzyme (double-stranded beta helix superfamily)
MAMKAESKVKEMIRLLDDAVKIQEEKGCCHAVKKALEDIVRSGDDFLDAHFLQPADGKYARRLVHKDPAGKYSVLAMVWDKGQGTSLHDHAGHWCVECVYRGRIRVVSYSLHGDEHADLVQFSPETEIMAGPGEAGALIPPFEYHTIANPDDTPAVTIHVYAGELDHCYIFNPVDGGFKREYRELTYTA